MSGRRERVNVLFAIGGMYIGGAEAVVANLCRHLDKDLFNASVYHIKGTGEIGSELLGEGFSVSGAPEVKTLLDLKYLRFRKLRRIIERDRIDIIHSHDVASLMDAGSCRLLSGNFRLVHTFHFGNYPHIGRGSYLLQKAFWRVPDRLVAVGVEQKASIQKTFAMPSKRIIPIWNGVEENRPEVDPAFRDRFGSGTKVIIGSISTFTAQKGLDHLLDTARALKERSGDFVFVVAGDGPLRGELEEKTRRLGLQETVIFTGWVKNASARLLPVFDIFYQPSLWEAMSVVVIEALAAGKPVVATRVGENMHVVQDGKSGFIVEPRNTEQSVSALLKLVRDEGMRARFGLEGRRFFKSKCMVSHMVKKYEDLYLGLIPDRCKSSSTRMESSRAYEQRG